MSLENFILIEMIRSTLSRIRQEAHELAYQHMNKEIDTLKYQVAIIELEFEINELEDISKSINS